MALLSKITQSQSILCMDDVFRRLAFGLIDTKHSDNSVASACGLILNYLDRTINPHIISEVLKAEELKGSDFDSLRYPNAAQLYKYLQSSCKLRPVSRGLWGATAVKNFNQNWTKLPWVHAITVKATFGGYGKDKAWKLVVGEVALSRPAMVTLKSIKLNSKQHRFYTVAVCGYRITLTGKRELLVHSGCYGEKYIKGSRAQLMYVSINDVLCSYKFKAAALKNA